MVPLGSDGDDRMLTRISGKTKADIVRGSLLPAMAIGALAIWRARRHVPGRMLVLIGSLHLAGLLVARDPLRRIVNGGVINEAESAVGHIPRKANQELIFWFSLWGLLTIVIGELVIAMEQRGQEPPRWIGWQLIGLNIASAALMPKGGFWWVLLPGALIARGSRPQLTA